MHARSLWSEKAWDVSFVVELLYAQFCIFDSFFSSVLHAGKQVSDRRIGIYSSSANLTTLTHMMWLIIFFFFNSDMEVARLWSLALHVDGNVRGNCQYNLYLRTPLDCRVCLVVWWACSCPIVFSWAWKSCQPSDSLFTSYSPRKKITHELLANDLSYINDFISHEHSICSLAFLVKGPNMWLTFMDVVCFYN